MKWLKRYFKKHPGLYEQMKNAKVEDYKELNTEDIEQFIKDLSVFHKCCFKTTKK